MTTSLFDLILIGMSVYVLYNGIVGKGRLYEIDNLKEGKEELFYSVSRKLYLGLGIMMLINSVSSLLLTELYTYDEAYQLTVSLYDLGKWSFLTPNLLRTVSYVALGFLLVLLVAIGVFMSKVTDRNAPPKKKSSGAKKNRGDRREVVKLPSHAFDFEPQQEENGQQASAASKKK